MMFKKVLFSTAAALLVLGVAVSPVFAASIVVRVPSSAGWVDAGIDVEPGEVLYLSSHGMAITGPLSEYPEAISDTGGQVTTCYDGALPGMVCALDGAPFGALIGRIDGGAVFLIGGSGSFVAGSSGRLYLAVNDFLGTYGDNLGGFTVVFEGL